MHNVYLGLGTNLGNRTENINEAIQRINDRIGSIVKISNLYQTKPIGFSSDNDFINAACLVETMLTPEQILEITKEIEQDMGRTSKSVNHTYADRIIDIDLLLYDNLIRLTLDLTLPHPQIQNRMFVLDPLVDIAPDYVHPILNLSINELKVKL